MCISEPAQHFRILPCSRGMYPLVLELLRANGLPVEDLPPKPDWSAAGGGPARAEALDNGSETGMNLHPPEEVHLEMNSSDAGSARLFKETDKGALKSMQRFLQEANIYPTKY